VAKVSRVAADLGATAMAKNCVASANEFAKEIVAY
jgi:hypothetical protein